MANEKPTPGYRSPYFWLLLGPVMLSVVLGTTFLVASIISWDGVVVDNYYEDGKSIQMRQEEDIAASNMNLQALMLQQSDQLMLQLTGSLANYPQSLTLKVIHPTKSTFDQSLTLERTDGNRYILNEGSLTVDSERQLQLQPNNTEQMWRLHGTLAQWPAALPVNLSPAVWQ